MKNKKLLIVILAIVLIGAGILYFLSKTSPQEENEVGLVTENNMTSEEVQLENEAGEVATKISDFTDNTTEEYLSSIEPYMSEQLFEEQKELVELQKEFNKKQGFITSQKYTLSKVELIERSSEDGDVLTYKVTGVREYPESKENDITYIKYEKLDGKWKIIAIEPEL